MKRELETLEKALDAPRRPLVAVMGGGKVTSKIEVLAHLARRVDALLIGGAMALPFLKARGLKVGKADVPSDAVEKARGILKGDEGVGGRLFLPVDLVTADQKAEGAVIETVPSSGIEADRLALDIGPETIDLFVSKLEGAGTIVWNGPLGVFEMEPFSKGTRAVAEAIARSPAFSLVGGGDTGSAIDRYGLRDRISYVSTGGGAFLDMLAGRELPAVRALEMAHDRVANETRT